MLSDVHQLVLLKYPSKVSDLLVDIVDYIFLDGPGLDHFIQEAQVKKIRKPKVFPLPVETRTYLNPEDFNGNGKTG